MKNKVSVIIPVYNQIEALRTVLLAFNEQDTHGILYEIIVVDDGSEESVCDRIDKKEYSYKLNIISQKNMGRAIARNNGVENAEGDILIFCDADRIPEKDFISKHFVNCQRDVIGFGQVKDYFGRDKIILDKRINYEDLRKYSRNSVYYNKVSHLFNGKEVSSSPISWCSFFVGNSCMYKSTFKKVGGFDTDFREWGFEHYEFALRAIENNIYIKSISDVTNYHIPHPRENGYYANMLSESMEIFKQKTAKNVTLLLDFLFGNISLQQFEYLYAGKLSYELQQVKEEVYYKSLT